VTDWTQVKPGTKVRGRYEVNYAATFVAMFEGFPLFRFDATGDFGHPAAPEFWVPIPTTYTLTLTGPMGDSESVEVSRSWVESWGEYDNGKIGLACAALLAREGEGE